MTASKTCGLVDECKYNNGECSQVCVDTYDSYYCTCRQGYRLARNEYTCPGKLSRFPWAVICTLLALLVYYFLFLRSTHRNILFVAAPSDYYFARGSGCEVLWWICLSVCLSVCPRGYLRNYMRDLYQFFVHVAYVRGSVLFWHVDSRPHHVSAGRGWRECTARAIALL